MDDQSKLTAMISAKSAQKSGAVNPASVGGAHRDVRAYSNQYAIESNHTPPKDVYKSSPYDSIAEDDMPAVSMSYYHHRNPSAKTATTAKGLGGPGFMLGGASSTGGSGVHKGWDAELAVFMKAGEFYKAMAKDANDILNTTYPNHKYYQDGLAQAAIYASKFMFKRSDTGADELLIKDDKELAYVLSAIYSRG